jgi:hypothetical protein
MVGRTPWSARFPLEPLAQASNTGGRPTWASAADQGVRPTLHSSDSPRYGQLQLRLIR